MAALAESVGLEQFSLAGLPLPVTLRLDKPMTDQELIAFSYRIRPYQVERNASGELEIMSPNATKGASFEAYAIGALGNWAEQNGGVVISSQGGFTLGDSSVRMADASWIAPARWDALTDAEQEGFPPMSPDFLIEIRSQSDARTKLERKMRMWIANGTQLAWMIDPSEMDVTVYRPELEPERFTKPDWVEAETVVPGFRLQTARMWQRKGK